MTSGTVPFALLTKGAVRRCELIMLSLAIGHALGVLQTPLECDVILGSVHHLVHSLPHGACKAGQGGLAAGERHSP